LDIRPLVGNAGTYKFILTVKDDFEEDPGSKSYNIKLTVNPSITVDLFEEENEER